MTSSDCEEKMEVAVLIARAAAESTDRPNSILTYVPFTICIIVLCAIVYAMVKSLRQYGELCKRSLQHMDRVEARNEEIVTLLKEIRDQPQ
jgi:hypothetical protein